MSTSPRLRVLCGPLPSAVVADLRSCPDSLNACALYTREEVAALAGESARKPRAFTIDPATHSSCTTATSMGKLTVKVYIEGYTDKQALQMSLRR